MQGSSKKLIGEFARTWLVSLNKTEPSISKRLVTIEINKHIYNVNETVKTMQVNATQKTRKHSYQIYALSENAPKITQSQALSGLKEYDNNVKSSGHEEPILSEALSYSKPKEQIEKIPPMSKEAIKSDVEKFNTETDQIALDKNKFALVIARNKASELVSLLVEQTNLSPNLNILADFFVKNKTVFPQALLQTVNNEFKPENYDFATSYEKGYVGSLFYNTEAGYKRLRLVHPSEPEISPSEIRFRYCLKENEAEIKKNHFTPSLDDKNITFENLPRGVSSADFCLLNIDTDDSISVSRGMPNPIPIEKEALTLIYNAINMAPNNYSIYTLIEGLGLPLKQPDSIRVHHRDGNITQIQVYPDKVKSKL